jgi:Galactose oxidase, central domain/Kelch motif
MPPGRVYGSIGAGIVVSSAAVKRNSCGHGAFLAAVVVSCHLGLMSPPHCTQAICSPAVWRADGAPSALELSAAAASLGTLQSDSNPRPAVAGAHDLEARLEALPPPANSGHAAVMDARNARMLVIGGQVNSLGEGRDVWTLPLQGESDWARLETLGDSPSARARAVAVYDSANQRVIVFGGVNTHSLNDTWILSLSDSTPHWSQVFPQEPLPPPLKNHVGVYDPVYRRCIFFGGNDGAGPNATTSVLKTAGTFQWRQLPSGPSTPPARELAAATYDSKRHRMIIFGGLRGYFPTALLNDTWALSLDGEPTWHPITTHNAGPSPRYGHSAIYDPIGDRIVVFGGADNLNPLDELWGLDLQTSTWSRLEPSGSGPAASALHSAIYDTSHKRMIVHGVSSYETWALELSSLRWTLMSPLDGVPLTLSSHAAALDPKTDDLIIYGGRGDVFDDAWRYSDKGWSRIRATGPAPLGRVAPASAFVAEEDALYIYGGVIAGGGAPQDLWRLSLGDAPYWTELTTDGERPPGGITNALVYDAEGTRLLLINGQPGGVWELGLQAPVTWKHLETSAGPSARRRFTATIDPLRRRLIVFGGLSQEGGALDDCWTLSLGSLEWQRVALGPLSPPPRYSHSAVRVRDRLLIVGGWQAGQWLGDIWTCDLASLDKWQRLDPNGDSLQPIAEQSTVLDAHRGRVLIAAPPKIMALDLAEPVLSATLDIRPNSPNNVVSLESSGLLTAALLSSAELSADMIDVPSVRLAGAPVARARVGDAKHDRADDLVMQFRVSDLTLSEQDTIAIITGRTRSGEEFEGHDAVHCVVSHRAVPHTPDDQRPMQLGIVSGRAAAGTVTVTLALAGLRRDHLELMDVTGRLVDRWGLTSLGTGRHVLTLKPRRPLAPGVYFLRLHQHPELGSVRVVVMR